MTRRLSGALLLVGALILSCTSAPAWAARRVRVLSSVSFTGATDGASFVPFTHTPGFPCLTAGTDRSARPIPGCGLAVPDPVGTGALRLTDTGDAEASAVIFDGSFPTREGLDITFQESQYGGDHIYHGLGGDGISLDLLAAPPLPRRIGPTGSGLGYDLQPPALNMNPLAPTVPGIPAGYLGIGLDVFGYYTSSQADEPGCAAPSWSTFAPIPNQVTVRGPGNGVAGYCLRSGTQADHPDPMGAIPLEGASRAASQITVNAIFDASHRTYAIRLAPVGATRFTTVTRGRMPGFYFAPRSGRRRRGLPPRLTFMLAGSTGYANDIHEISSVRVTSYPPSPTRRRRRRG